MKITTKKDEKNPKTYEVTFTGTAAEFQLLSEAFAMSPDERIQKMQIYLAKNISFR